MEFAYTFWASVIFIGGTAFALWLFKPGVGDAPSNWQGFVAYFFQSARERGVDYVNEDEDERPTAPGFAPGFETVSRGVSDYSDAPNSSQTPDLDFIDPKWVDRLAELVYRGELGKTAAIKIGLQLPSGEKYQRGKAALDEALARQSGKAVEDDRDKRLEQVAQQAALRH